MRNIELTDNVYQYGRIYFNSDNKHWIQTKQETKTKICYRCLYATGSRRVLRVVTYQIIFVVLLKKKSHRLFVSDYEFINHFFSFLTENR